MPGPRFHQGAQRQGVSPAEHAVGGRMRLQQRRQRRTAVAEVGRRRHRILRHRVSGQLVHGVGKCLAAGQRAAVAWGNDRRMTHAAAVQVAGGRFAHFLVRKADQHVDRRRRQVPGLHHRNAGRVQALPRRRRMHHTGQHDARRAPADDGVEQRILARLVIAALAYQQLIAGVGQRGRHRLRGFLEHRARQGGHQRHHHPAAARCQRAGHQVGHITGLAHRFQYPLQGVG